MYVTFVVRIADYELPEGRDCVPVIVKSGRRRESGKL